jgi:hypothetical protein
MTRSNEWGESLEQTVERSRIQNGLLVYSMVAGETIRVGINGTSPEGVVLEPSRSITARATGQHGGVLEVLDDTAPEDSWRDRMICLGSFAYKLGNLEFIRGGLLRGMIANGAGVVVDLNGQHFVGDTEPNFLKAEYETLILEDQVIF